MEVASKPPRDLRYHNRATSPEECGLLWWYSRFFDVVELNNSFYAVPSEDTVHAWVKRNRLASSSM